MSSMLEVHQYYSHSNHPQKRLALHDISNKQHHKKAKEYGLDELEIGIRDTQREVVVPKCIPLHSHTNETTTTTTTPLPSLPSSSPSTVPVERFSFFAKLPVETALLLFSFLPTCLDSLKARLVCTQWDKLLRDKHLRRIIYHDDLFRQSETSFCIKLDYMQHLQREIDADMRGILIDWLAEVADEFGFHSETLYLCVNYLDRYLCVQPVPRGKLQLVGITCLIIAAKYEEIQLPRVEEFVTVSADTCKREDIIRMELHVLNKLGFSLSVVTSGFFLMKYLSVVPISGLDKDPLIFLSNLLIDLSLLEYRMVKYPPSLISAASMCLALHTLSYSAWTYTLEYYTQRSVTDMEMQHCIADLYELLKDASNHKLRAIPEKYSQPKFCGVMKLPLPSSLPQTCSPLFNANIH